MNISQITNLTEIMSTPPITTTHQNNDGYSPNQNVKQSNNLGTTLGGTKRPTPCLSSPTSTPPQSPTISKQSQVEKTNNLDKKLTKQTEEYEILPNL